MYNIVKDCDLNWFHGEKEVSVTAASGSSLKYRILKYAESHPNEVRIEKENEDGSVFAHIPLSWVRVSPPRQLSPEQIEANRERLKAMREKQKAEK